MRSLEEYQAEIFRRSKARIEKRKKLRIRIISLCIPLCLCAGAWLLWQHPKETANRSPEETFVDMEAPMAADAPESMMHARAEWETPKGIVYTVTELSSITALENILLYSNDTITNSSGITGYDQHKEHDSGCRITLITSDGMENSWILQENTLTNCQTGVIITLTEDDLTRLYEIFGITEY